MAAIAEDDPRAIAVVAAIRTGDVHQLEQLLTQDAGLATARLGADGPDGMTRSLLHVVTDWPGHFPNGARTVAVLVAAGADVNARFHGSHAETPLHWAASNDDVAVLDALLDAGADIEAPGAVLGGGSPLADAVGFAQWNAARRLVERGARVDSGQAAALGMIEQVHRHFAADHVDRNEVDRAFWLACHGGQRATAAYLIERGATLNWLPSWERLTPLDAARRNGFDDVAEWLRGQGARPAAQLD